MSYLAPMKAIDRDLDHRAAQARRVLACLDLTRLDENDSIARMLAFADTAVTPYGEPAALCVYPEFVHVVRARLDEHELQQVAVATVVNFPDGSTDAQRVARETRRALAVGANEIDLVLPYGALLDGDCAAVTRVVGECRRACGEGVVLKVILETGALALPDSIARAAMLAIESGADFLKTSTGKGPPGATPAAVRVMLDAIVATGADCGIKVSGGVRTLADAMAYADLVASVLGADAVDPRRFRIGASALLAELLNVLSRADECGQV